MARHGCFSWGNDPDLISLCRAFVIISIEQSQNTKPLACRGIVFISVEIIQMLSCLVHQLFELKSHATLNI